MDKSDLHQYRNFRPRVIGLYGLPGSGKTYLLKQLETELGTSEYAFYDGSAMLAKVVGAGGLAAFQAMDSPTKTLFRQEAIQLIFDECKLAHKTGIVAGHALLQEEGTINSVLTSTDFEVYSHIIYLDVAIDVLEHRRTNDGDRVREMLPTHELRAWQNSEKDILRTHCYINGVLLHVLSKPDVSHIISYIQEFTSLSEDLNYDRADDRLEELLKENDQQITTTLVFDGDRTLAPEDTGPLFWKHINQSAKKSDVDPVSKLFSSTSYSWTSFRQATLLYEEACDHDQFREVCARVATEVNMYPEIVSLLQMVAEHTDIKVVVVTAGLGLIWETVLERAGLSESVIIIGNGRLSDAFVVTADVKAALVRTLSSTYGHKVLAFGDSVLDIPMFTEADHAIVVVGDEKTRSRTMDAAIRTFLGYGDEARQALLPATVTPRLDVASLPLVDLTSPTFFTEIFHPLRPRCGLRVTQATDTNSAKLLMAPMRDAQIYGPALREAHRRVGWYLATQDLCDIVGLEKQLINHVDGTTTDGHRFLREDKITIVALMRGGEPMALGVNDAAPAARFVHASSPEDLKKHHIEGQITVVLVDSVVNSGKTVFEFMQHIRNIHAMIRIVVVAGVVQEDFITQGGLNKFLNVNLVTLRTSKNKYTGSGSTDTGNRLFNTTHLK